MPRLKSAQVLDALALRIKELRLARGMTQQQFAELMGYERKHQSKVESGRENPTVESLVGIANALGVTMPDLFQQPHPKTVRRPGKPRRDQT